MRKKEVLPRKRRRELGYADKYEIAYLLHFKGYNVKSVAYVYGVSTGYVSRIKKKFVTVVETWRDKPPPEQRGFDLKDFSRYLTAPDKK